MRMKLKRGLLVAKSKFLREKFWRFILFPEIITEVKTLSFRTHNDLT